MTLSLIEANDNVRKPTEMELRVAKAICLGLWREQSKAEREIYFEQARRAFRAMSELSFHAIIDAASPVDISKPPTD